MDKVDKEIKKEERDSGIKVECPNCNHIDELKDLTGWSFVVLKTTKCEKCNTTITHDNIIDD